MYGKQVESSVPSHTLTSVIGDIQQAPAGNMVLRIGRLNPDGSWTQTEYVVLTPAETLRLTSEMLTKLTTVGTIQVREHTCTTQIS